MIESTGGPTINEFHYDNIGTDVGEFVELKAPAGTDFTGYEIELYNGNSNTVYSTITIDATMNGTAVTGSDGDLYLTISTGLQNGAPDGIAVVNPAGTVCEFLSYEGTLTAVNGAAVGLTSTDVNATEDNTTTPAGDSIQLFEGLWYNSAQTPSAANECFVTGTKILTAKGKVKVEDLREGDEVISREGNKKKIVWIGKQQVSIEDSVKVASPVCIKKDALGDHVPSADLYVSQDHAIFFEDVLINAGAMVNGRTIIQEKAKEDYSYFHVELEDHSLIYAENCLAESYLAQNFERSSFDNGEDYLLQNRYSDKTVLWPMSIPRISSYHKVPDYIRRKLNGEEESLKQVS